MPKLYWTKYDQLQFAARHILENFDVSQIKNHNSFWPAGTSKEYLPTLLEWLVANHSTKILLPPKGACGDGFATYEILLDFGITIRLGVSSQGRISLLQPLYGPNVVRVNSEEAKKIFTILFSNVEKRG
jgi:hypothetical protein